MAQQHLELVVRPLTGESIPAILAASTAVQEGFHSPAQDYFVFRFDI